ncbi:hypothetical protein F5B17DRAFT_427887 [Nemania serpens]|nr:hypothetical protein F5B17DRAFT_427887 [Nemania serpens]
MDFSAGNRTEAAQQCEQGDGSVRPVAVASMPPPQTDHLFYYIQRPATTYHTASGTVTRPGPSVPLIAVDQLPPWVDVVGIPRELSHEQAMNLYSLGIVPKGEPYEIHVSPTHLQAPEIPSSQMDPAAMARTSQKAQLVSRHATINHYSGQRTKNGVGSTDRPKDTVRDRPLMGLHQRPASPAPLSASRENPYPMMYATGLREGKSHTSGRRGLVEHPAERLLRASRELTLRETRTAESRPFLTTSSRLSSSTSPSSSSSSSATTTTMMTTRKVNTTSNAKKKNKNKNRAASARKTGKKGKTKEKLYCRNWCRHGTCGFGKACWYRHEMPHTAHGLRQVGLSDYPPWWAAHLGHMSKYFRSVEGAAIPAATKADTNSISSPSGSGQKKTKEESGSALARQQEQKQYRDKSEYMKGGHVNIYDRDRDRDPSTWTYPSNPPFRSHSPNRSLGLIKAQNANGGLPIIPSSPSTPRTTKKTAFPAQDVRIKARAPRPSHTRSRAHHDIRRDAARSHRGRTNASASGSARRPSFSPNVFERELAAAAAAEEERWVREQERIGSQAPPGVVEAGTEAGMEMGRNMKRGVEGVRRRREVGIAEDKEVEEEEDLLEF